MQGAQEADFNQAYQSKLHGEFTDNVERPQLC